MHKKSIESKKGKSPVPKGSKAKEAIENPNISSRGLSNKQGDQFGEEIVDDPNNNQSQISQFNYGERDQRVEEVVQGGQQLNQIKQNPEDTQHNLSNKETNSNSSKSSKRKFRLPKCQKPTINCVTQLDCLKKIAGSCDWFNNLSTKGKAGVIILAALLATGIILTGVLVHLLVPAPPEGMYLNPIQNNGTVIYSNVMEGTTKDNHRYSAHLTQWKTSVSHPTLEAVTRTERTSQNQEEIYLNVPILPILDNFGASHKQQKAYTDWLDHYNSNSQQTINKLIETIKTTLSRPGTYKFGKRIPDNLTLVSVDIGNEIDVEYLPLESKFIASQFDAADVDTLKMEFETDEKKDSNKNLKKEETSKDSPKKENKSSKDTPKKQETKKAETKQDTSKDTQKKETPSKENKPFEKPTEQQESLMAKVMLETVYCIKRVVARNLEVLRAKSAELMAYQKNLVAENEIQQEWQKALINGCRTVQSLRFRCTFEAAGVLVPGLTMEKIRGSNDYLVSQTLNLVFKEVKELSE